MAYRPTVGIVSAQSLNTVNDFWNFGLRRGPGNFSVTLSRTGQRPIEFYGMYDASATEEDSALWQALTDGVLPEGVAYGEDGIPSESALLSACTPENLVISSNAGGVMTSVEHFNGVLAGMGLQIVEVFPWDEE